MVEPALYVYFSTVLWLPWLKYHLQPLSMILQRHLFSFHLSCLFRALDFLYMDYKPPRPLEILISSDILSKYQRMFTFILRLLRGKKHDVFSQESILNPTNSWERHQICLSNVYTSIDLEFFVSDAYEIQKTSPALPLYISSLCVKPIWIYFRYCHLW